MIKTIKSKKGMTLMEVIIIMLILTILMGAVYLVFNQSVKSVLREDSRVEIQQNIRLVTTQLETDFRKSEQNEVGQLVDGCYYVNLNKYCLVDGSIYRNDVAIAAKVNVFNITSNIEKTIATIKVESSEDDYGQVVSIETQVTLRGNRDENQLDD